MIIGNCKSRRVFIDGEELTPGLSQVVCNHSPDGFNWGYSGSGPAQLALALLLEFSDAGTAEAHYQDFKGDVISQLPKDEDFQLDEAIVSGYLHGVRLPTGG